MYRNVSIVYNNIHRHYNNTSIQVATLEMEGNGHDLVTELEGSGYDLVTEMEGNGQRQKVVDMT